MKHLEKRLRRLEQRRRAPVPFWKQIKRLLPEEYAEFMRPVHERWREELIAGGRWTLAREARYQQLMAEERMRGQPVIEDWRRFVAETWPDELEAEGATEPPLMAGPARARRPVAVSAQDGEEEDDEEEDEAPAPARVRPTAPRASSSPYAVGGERSAYWWRDDRYTRLK